MRNKDQDPNYNTCGSPSLPYSSKPLPNANRVTWLAGLPDGVPGRVEVQQPAVLPGPEGVEIHHQHGGHGVSLGVQAEQDLNITRPCLQLAKQWRTTIQFSSEVVVKRIARIQSGTVPFPCTYNNVGRILNRNSRSYLPVRVFRFCYCRLSKKS